MGKFRGLHGLEAILMEWVCAALTVITYELLARKKWYGWGISLLSNMCWYFYTIQTRQWGMLALTTICTIQSVRGLIRWKKNRGTNV